MSLPSSSNEPLGPYRKPKPDIYTVLLAIALVAVLLGILFLYLELDMYQFKLAGRTAMLRPAASAVAAMAAVPFPICPLLHSLTPGP